VALLMVACAASTSVTPMAAEPGIIDDVRIESHGDSTSVTLIGLEEPIFTAFAQRNPERLVVDVVSASPGAEIEPMTVQDGLVDEVTLVPYETAGGEPMTRVEVSLTTAADQPTGWPARISIPGTCRQRPTTTAWHSSRWPWCPRRSSPTCA
jgi:hypothetical protein